MGLEILSKLVYESSCRRLLIFLEVLLSKYIQCSKSFSHRNRVARQCARLVHRPFRGDVCHYFVRCSIGADGHTSTNNFTIGNNIGFDSIIMGSTLESQTESSYNFVKDQ